MTLMTKSALNLQLKNLIVSLIRIEIMQRMNTVFRSDDEVMKFNMILLLNAKSCPV